MVRPERSKSMNNAFSKAFIFIGLFVIAARTHADQVSFGIDLDIEQHRPAAYRAILDVLLTSGREIDHDGDVLAAIGAGDVTRFQVFAHPCFTRRARTA